ncbi:pyruvate, phosphate dikinase [Actinomycetospora sp. OC33-EN08]|uniref:Pyruvate, phosphate dikinase n=1 Tax=Actinomycetospora aurantiaca TaxID=3129233 RepID=A0ABU8MLD5_9PSEU
MSTTTTRVAPRWTVVPDDPAVEPSKELVGGKAWSLWRMRSLGLPVPPAFVVTTEACRAYFAEGGLPAGLEGELVAGIRLLERELDRTFGGTERPLLVSVRSGAAVSMPGMMDTILDLGMNPDVEAALAAEAGDATFAAEVHRRFCGFYGRQVLGCTEELEDLPDTDAVRRAIADDVTEEIPADPWEQLRAAVGAVFASSRSRRAVAYRKHWGIRDDLGTAVTVQAMVFGNLDDSSGTGVLFTRSPVDGTREPYGEYLPRGQGEDVVSGRITPRPLTDLAERLPAVHDELLTAARRLDDEGRDAQDIEFTVQHGSLYLLQSRPAKRTARAAVRIARALVREGTLTPAEAVRRVNAEQAVSLLRPEIDGDAAAAATLLAAGAAASPGVATGVVVGTAEEAQRHPGSVLARHTTSPEDVQGMIAASAVITEVGGTTSHAAVVGRALDVPCVVGCGAGVVASLAGRTVTVDATSGRIYDGEIAVTAADECADDDLVELTAWADEFSPVRVLAADGEAACRLGPVFDGDTVDPEALGDGVPTIPPGATAVRGAVFQSADGARAALDAGVGTIVATRRLPVLLAAIAHHDAHGRTA